MSINNNRYRHTLEEEQKNKEEIIELNNKKTICDYYIIKLDKIINNSSKREKNILFINEGKFLKSKIPPKVDIIKYFERITYYTKPEDNTLIFSLILMERLFRNGITLSDYNIHKILFISIVSAQKFLEDIVPSNNYYATIGGISIKVFNELESEFLFVLNFLLYISESEFQKYVNE